MTLNLFLRLAPAVTIGTLLLCDLAVPFGPLRRWLAAGPYVAHTPDGDAWAVVWPDRGGAVQPVDTAAEGNAKVGYANRVRGWLNALLACPWCTSAWVSLAALAFVPGDFWERVQWWPLLWLAGAYGVLVGRRLAD